jgi:hypothetical protein
MTRPSSFAFVYNGQTFFLSHTQAADLLSEIDIARFASETLLEQMSEDSSSVVRKAVARHPDLPRSMVVRLASDPCMEVRQAVLKSKGNFLKLRKEEVIESVDEQPLLFETISWFLMSHKDAAFLLKHYRAHPDPVVQDTIDENCIHFGSVERSESEG